MTGYESPSVRVADCARTLLFGLRELTPRRLLGLLAELPVLLGYLCRVPRAQVRLSERPAGRMIAEHLSLRRWGVPRFRLAQGVLHLPADFPAYLRGRRRQALRTNVRRARQEGIRCERVTVANWKWPSSDRELRQSAPTEHWRATDRHGILVGEAWVTVDDECALLHAMACSQTATYTRWAVSSLFRSPRMTRSPPRRSCRTLDCSSGRADVSPGQLTVGCPASGSGDRHPRFPSAGRAGG